MQKAGWIWSFSGPPIGGPENDTKGLGTISFSPVIARLDRAIQRRFVDSPVEPWNDDWDWGMTKCR